MEELTAGQAQTLARNEQVIDTSTDELEDLEEQLNSSIAESLRGKKNKMQADNLKSDKRWVDPLHLADFDFLPLVMGNFSSLGTVNFFCEMELCHRLTCELKYQSRFQASSKRDLQEAISKRRHKL